MNTPTLHDGLVRFYIPMRPYGIGDAINRYLAATGSPREARGTSRANFNGHEVSVSWNAYRGFYVAEYFWGERVVLARGSLAACVEAAVAEYNRGALGAAVRFEVLPRDAEDPSLSPRLGIRPWSTEDCARTEAWRQNWRLREVPFAVREGNGALLQKQCTEVEYRTEAYHRSGDWFGVEGNGFRWAKKVSLSEGSEKVFLLWDGEHNTALVSEDQAGQQVRSVRANGKLVLGPREKLNQLFRDHLRTLSPFNS